MWIERRWLATGLGISLLINVFLIGIVAGHAFASRGHRLPGTARALLPAARVRALPADERQRYRAAMVPYRTKIAAARSNARAARQTVETDIAAADYDRAKTTADFAAMRQSADELQELVHGALADALSTLSPASRRALLMRNRRAP